MKPCIQALPMLTTPVENLEISPNFHMNNWKSFIVYITTLPTHVSSHMVRGYIAFNNAGDMPLSRHLSTIDKVLSQFEPIDPQTEVKDVPRFDQPRKIYLTGPPAASKFPQIICLVLQWSLIPRDRSKCVLQPWQTRLRFDWVWFLLKVSLGPFWDILHVLTVVLVIRWTQFTTVCCLNWIEHWIWLCAWNRILSCNVTWKCVYVTETGSPPLVLD